jgi:hypothetical protein
MNLPTRSEFNAPREKSSRFRSTVFHRAVELGGVVIAQPPGIQALRQISAVMKVPRDFDIFCPFTVQSRARHRSRQAYWNTSASPARTGRGNANVLTDEMHHLALWESGPPTRCRSRGRCLRVFAKARHVAHRRIQPHRILARRTGDLGNRSKAESRLMSHQTRSKPFCILFEALPAVRLRSSIHAEKASQAPLRSSARNLLCTGVAPDTADTDNSVGRSRRTLRSRRTDQTPRTPKFSPRCTHPEHAFNRQRPAARWS